VSGFEQRLRNLRPAGGAFVKNAAEAIAVDLVHMARGSTFLASRAFVVATHRLGRHGAFINLARVSQFGNTLRFLCLSVAWDEMFT
jgi:hypothetical protein